MNHDKEQIREAIGKLKKLDPKAKAFACGKMAGRCDKKAGEGK